MDDGVGGHGRLGLSARGDGFHRVAIHDFPADFPGLARSGVAFGASLYRLSG
jgi:hypothetical protein